VGVIWWGGKRKVEFEEEGRMLRVEENVKGLMGRNERLL
jgi:hypothetical protein